MLAGNLVSEKKLSEKPALYNSWSYTYEFYAQVLWKRSKQLRNWISSCIKMSELYLQPQ
jgi:hypothetical protein